MKNNKPTSSIHILMIILFSSVAIFPALAKKGPVKTISGIVGYMNSNNMFKKVDHLELAGFFRSLLSLPAQTRFEDYNIQYIPAKDGKHASIYLQLRSSNSTVIIASSLTKISRRKYAIDGNAICKCTTASYNADKNYEVTSSSDGCLCKSTANIAEKTSIAVNAAYIQKLFEKQVVFK